MVNAIVSIELTRSMWSMKPDLDLTAIRLVARDGHRMPLKGEDRDEAIKIMVEHKVPREVIAWRLCMTVAALNQHATRKKLKLTPIKDPAHWTSKYIANRNEDYWRQRAATKRDERRRAKESN